NADGGRAAAHAHAFFFDAVDDGRLARLHHQLRATIDAELYRLLVAQRHHYVAGNAAFFFAAAGKVVHTTQGKHLRTVFGRGDVADDLALVAYVGLLGTKIAVGIDLYLEAAVAEDAFCYHRDHVDAIGLGGHDEGRRLVVGIRGARPHAADEKVGLGHQ